MVLVKALPCFNHPFCFGSEGMLKLIFPAVQRRSMHDPDLGVDERYFRLNT